MCTRLYVGHLSSRTRRSDLDDMFGRYGRVRNVDMKHDYAFVEFSDPRDAEDARYRMNGQRVNGSHIIVEFAKGTPRGPGGSRDHGGRGPPPGAGRCFNCGIDGHWARDCKAGDWKNKCYRCGKRGHIERNCQNSPKKLRRGRSYSRSPSPRRRSPSPRSGRSRSRSYRRDRGYSRSSSPRRRSPSPHRGRSRSGSYRELSRMEKSMTDVVKEKKHKMTPPDETSQLVDDKKQKMSPSETLVLVDDKKDMMEAQPLEWDDDDPYIVSLKQEKGVYIGAAFRSQCDNQVFMFIGHEFVVINYDPSTPAKDCVVRGPLFLEQGFGPGYITIFQEYGVSAAFSCHDSNHAFLFQNQRCAKIEYPLDTTKKGRVIDHDKTKHMFPCLEGTSFDSGIDAAFQSTEVGQAYLFFETEYAILDYKKGFLIARGDILEEFPCLKGTIFESDIGAAFASHKSNEVYLFKKNNYLLMHFTPGDPTKSNIIENCKEIIPNNWPSLKSLLPYLMGVYSEYPYTPPAIEDYREISETASMDEDEISSKDEDEIDSKEEDEIASKEDAIASKGDDGNDSKDEGVTVSMEELLSMRALQRLEKSILRKYGHDLP